MFDDWFAGSANADDEWRDYEQLRGRSYVEALRAPAARHIYDFDLHYLRESREAVLIAPAGRSAHLELGWTLGQGKRGYVLLEPDSQRWDVMYQFATGVFTDVESLILELESRKETR